MFLKPDQNALRLPVVLLAGFLGSGKTTLVNRLLRDPRLADTAVAVNEFGAVPLDAHLIDHGPDQTIVMANGCLCCNLAGDMEAAVMRIFSRRQAGALPGFKRLIIEPSGLADPAPIAQAILRNPVMSRAFRLEGITATVDALFGLRQIAQHAETAKQIAMADRLVITKPDLASDLQDLEREVRRLNPRAPIIRALHGEADPAAVLPEGFVNPAAAVPVQSFMIADGGPVHDQYTSAVLLVATAPLDWRNFDAWLREIRITHAEHLLRVKGVVNLARSGVPVVIQGVHHVLHPPVELARWPDADRRSRIVLITRGMPAGVIEAAWENSLPALYAAALVA